MKRYNLGTCGFILMMVILFPGMAIAQIDTLTIKINTEETLGPMDPIWAWWGYDEPNYTYMKDGKKLLSEISALSPVPVNSGQSGPLFDSHGMELS